MSTDTERRDFAVAQLQQTTLAYPEWRAKADRLGDDYRERSHWGRAFVALDLIGRVNPGTAPLPAEAAYSWLVLADNPGAALSSPLYYKLAVTADPAYRHEYTDTFWQIARQQGRHIAPWCDCRPTGAGTPPEVAYAMAAEYSLAPPLGQGETAAEGWAAVGAGMTIILGKIAEQGADVVELVKAGKVLWIEEDYWNCGAAPRDWHHLPVASALVAVYGDADCTYKPLVDYLAAERFTPHRDSLYAPGMTSTDWAMLP